MTLGFDRKLFFYKDIYCDNGPTYPEQQPHCIPVCAPKIPEEKNERKMFNLIRILVGNKRIMAFTGMPKNVIMYVIYCVGWTPSSEGGHPLKSVFSIGTAWVYLHFVRM